MKFGCVAIWLFASAPVHTQTASELHKKADDYYKRKEYLNCAEMNIMATKLDSNNSAHYYSAACCFALAGERLKAYASLDRAFSLSRRKERTFDWLKADADLVSLRKDTIWATKIMEWEGIVLSSIPVEYRPYRDTLLFVLERDQNERTPENIRRIDSLLKTYRLKDSAFVDSVAYKVDNENLVFLERIIAKIGWPTKQMVGDVASSVAFLVIQHSHLSTHEKYLPLIKKAVESGGARKSELALLIDRIRMEKGQKQLYGSQLRRNMKGELQFYEIEDEARVNERRTEMGLPSIEEYAKIFNIIYKPVNAKN